MIIPPIFDQPEAGFVLLKQVSSFRRGMMDGKSLRMHTASKRLNLHAERGGNVGALAGIGPYIGLDKDDPPAFEGITLPDTTTWETRPGRLGMRFNAWTACQSY